MQEIKLEFTENRKLSSYFFPAFFLPRPCPFLFPHLPITSPHPLLILRLHFCLFLLLSPYQSCPFLSVDCITSLLMPAPKSVSFPPLLRAWILEPRCLVEILNLLFRSVSLLLKGLNLYVLPFPHL